MNKLFKPQTIDAVLGRVQEHGEVYTRTPLHVEFGDEYAVTQVVSKLEAKRPGVFNAVGSLCAEAIGHHLPVIDVDRGFSVATRHQTTKVVMGAREGVYRPTQSWLREIMADYGIDTEIREILKDDAYVGVCQIVGQVILRAPIGVLDGAASTSSGHGHVYVNRLFGESDHVAVLDELGGLGVVSQEWLGVVEKSGMGVVRTPWTTKDVRHHIDT